MPASIENIVVGAGSAGATMAARLSEDRSRHVLLIEAGPDYRSADTPPAISGPNFGMTIGLGVFHWMTLTARASASQAPRLFLQGRGVGGSSAVNGQGAVRGLPGDFDRWAANGCAGWAWHDVMPTFRRLEDDLQFGDRPYHGTGGPIPVTRTAHDGGAVSAALHAAATDLGHPEHGDLNAPDSTGVSPNTWNRRDGRRVSCNDAYLEHARERPNLHIEAGALATRVVFSGHLAVGVEVRTPEGERIIEGGEVILCAGAVHSPAILLRSGIGPADELRALGIEVLADLPGVGRNLRDHPMAWLPFPLRAHAEASLDTLPGLCVLRFSSSDDAAANDLELFPFDRGLFDPTEGGLAVALLQPFSRGHVRLVGPDPQVEPIVELGLLSDDRDVARMRAAVRYAAGLAEHRAFAEVADATPSLVGGEPVRDLGDDELDKCLAAGCIEYYHTAGTCRMGDPADPETVVDPDARVLGVDGLRVVDASIMHDLPRAPTHLTTVMIAEHLAERMRAT